MPTARTTAFGWGTLVFVFSITAVFVASPLVQARSARAAKASSASVRKQITDEFVKGLVAVKLTPEGAAQYAAGSDVLGLFGPAAASFAVRTTEGAFAGHSIQRYAPSNSQMLSMRGPQDDDGLSRTLIVRYDAAIAPREAARAIARSPFVEYAEAMPIRKECWTPNDPLLGQQWHLANIQAAKAWDIEKGSSTVAIAIVDNGIDMTHVDLASNVWNNPGEIGLDAQGHDKRSNGIDDDNDGYIDDYQGWDFAGASTGSAQDNDPNGGNHGVHVAGIAAAVTNNAVGVAGVANGCRIMVVKVAYDQDPGTLPFGFQGITYAADRGAKIINCSWGGGSASTTEQEVIAYATRKGSLVVCAAGNNSSDAMFYPASYPHVLSVTGSGSNDQPDPFYANFGPRVDVVAPGSNIMSTYMGGTYQAESGTSMASPCASGVAALVASHFPTLSPDQIAARVRVTSDPIDNLLYYTYQKKFGYGRVNAYRAVHDANVKAVWIDSVWVSGDNNNNGALEPGETGSIRVRFRNMLDPVTNLSATLIDTVYGAVSYMQILSPTATIGSMATLATATTSESSFLVHVDASAPQNTQLWFRCEFTGDGGYTDYRCFSMYINPTFVTLDANDIACTVNSRGDQAYNDFPSNQQGVGFTYKGSENLLFEGALVLATDAAHVVDVARNSPQGGQDTDFVMTQRVAFKVPATSASVEEAVGAFNDSGADSSRRLGVNVAQHHYEFTSAGDRNYVLLTYTVTNASQATLKNLYAGIYFDWDIGASGDSNYVEFDPVTQTGWIRKLNSTYPVCGSALVSNQATTFYALDNNANPTNPAILVNDGFTSDEKYTALTSGIGRRTSCIGDVGNMIGGGPVTLAPQQSTTFAYVISAGTDLAALQQATIAARAKWKELGGDITKQALFFSETYETSHRDTTLVGVAKNTTDASVSATVRLIGNDTASFSLLSPASITIPAKSSADVSLRFAPDTAGSKQVQLVINYGASADTVNVYGTALASGLGVDQEILVYDTTDIGASKSQWLTVLSSRADTLDIPWVITGMDSDAFTMSGIPSAINVAPGGATFPVTFRPVREGFLHALLTFTPPTGRAFTVTLEGIGRKTVGVADNSAPAAPVMVTNYPDPFSTRTQIIVTGSSDVRSMVVVDLLGRVVADLTPRMTASGASFDASLLPAGIYYAKIGTRSGVVMRPLNVVK